jgi:hypothetical protein
MRERWKQAGLVFLSFVAVVAMIALYPMLVDKIGIHTFYVAHIERRAPTELSLSPALPALGAGLLVGDGAVRAGDGRSVDRWRLPPAGME